MIVPSVNVLDHDRHVLRRWLARQPTPSTHASQRYRLCVRWLEDRERRLLDDTDHADHDSVCGKDGLADAKGPAIVRSCGQ